MEQIINQNFTELQSFSNWVAFRLIHEAGQDKPRKKPINPKTSGGAMANNPDTWTTFEQAFTFAENQGLFENNSGGIGFELGNSPYAVIDLDHVIQADGNLKDYAAEILELMNSYTEYSPSGLGLHIWFKLDTPLANFGCMNKNTSLDIEIYDTGRYITVTGKIYGEGKGIRNATGDLQKVLDKYFSKERKNNIKESHAPLSSVDFSWKSDSDFWDKIFNSRNGYQVRKLFDGDISNYPSHSEADLALCNYLAFWTRKSFSEIDRLFRQSGLYTEKWNEMRGNRTYGQITIEEAINGTNNEYNPVYNKPEYNERIENTELKSSIQEWQPPLNGYDYVNSGIFASDLENFRKLPEIKTGFKNLDEKQESLYPGVYVIGATPSLGKTSFSLQMADNIAKSGNVVLFFALEQNRLELTTKSISRLTVQNDTTKNHSLSTTSMNIRRGKFFTYAQEDAYKRALEDYKEYADRIVIIELSLDATITAIVETVKNFISFTGLKPVVFVDYLQIIRPDNEKQATKDFVDNHMRILKKLQSENELVMIVISSFNRTNYTSPVDYESFKETGSIEYTADVLWGMQPQIVATNGLFLSDDKAKRNKREEIDKATRAIPRLLMLKNLKNRYGQKNYSCGFIYDPRFDYFKPDLNFKEKENGVDQKTVL